MRRSRRFVVGRRERKKERERRIIREESQSSCHLFVESLEYPVRSSIHCIPVKITSRSPRYKHTKRTEFASPFFTLRTRNKTFASRLSSPFLPHLPLLPFHSPILTSPPPGLKLISPLFVPNLGVKVQASLSPFGNFGKRRGIKILIKQSLPNIIRRSHYVARLSRRVCRYGSGKLREGGGAGRSLTFKRER